MLRAPKLLRLFSFAVIDQALLSAANFLLAFLLIRYTTGADYGLFVLAQATIQLLIIAQNAWLSGPLFVLVPKKLPEDRRAMVGAIEASQRFILRWLVLLTLIVMPIGYFLGFWSGAATLICLVATLASWSALLREYCRTVLLSYGRSKDLLKIDTIYVVLLVAGALLAIIAPRQPVIAGQVIPLSPAFWAVLALAVASGVGSRIAWHMLAIEPGWTRTRVGARQHWRELYRLGLWSAIGSGIFWLFTQSYNYVIASQIGLDAVADINATRILLMPAILITVGVKGLLVPSAAGWLAESGVGKLLRRLSLFVLGIAVLDLIYFTFLWIFRHWITVDLMHKKIANLDYLLLLWGCVALLGLARDILQAGLQALERFKIIAALTGIAAVISLSIMWFGLKRWGAPATLVGQIVGETLILTGTVLLALQSHRRAKTAMPIAAA